MEICRWSSVSELRCVIQLAAGTRVLVPGTPGSEEIVFDETSLSALHERHYY